MPNAADGYYWSLGRMICRAAEAEVVLESLAGELQPEKGEGWYSGRNAEAVAGTVTAAADHWPTQATQICALVEVMRDGAEVRNWLVHAWVLSSEDGDWVELQKPMKRSVIWGRQRIYRDEIDMLAARFVWVLNAVTRVLNEHEWEEQGTLGGFVDPLPDPPPLPAFVERDEAQRRS